MPKVSSKNGCAVILAAGKGTRMHSDLPKALHTLLGEPMLAYTLAALKPLFADNIILVAGHKAQMLLDNFPEEHFVIQEQQLGTGHALKVAIPEVEGRKAEFIVVINADAPLVTTKLLEEFIAGAEGADIAFATIHIENAGMYGRVVRSGNKIKAIVEAKDYNFAEHGPESGEINAGLYYLRTTDLQNLLPLLKNDNKSGEYYLTDIIALGIERGLEVRGIDCGNDANLLGVNTPLELSQMEEMLRERIVQGLLENGVTVHAPHLLRASPFSRIDPGAEISGPCEIYGKSVIEKGAIIDSHCVVINSHIGSGAHVRSFCHIDNANLCENVQAGPYARLRPGARLCEDSHVGNFVELKKTILGKGSKANHLTYLGDTEIGEKVNIGAGTITCNFDGKNKFKTVIEDGAFIGSNTALVAPVKIGAKALIGAGSVITKDVPDNSLAIARERQKNLPGRNGKK